MYKLFILMIPVLIFTGCSSKTAEEYKKAADVSMKSNNITEAVKNYENLINEFPGSEFAPDAFYQLAVLYQNKMVKELSPEQSFEKASETFRMFQEKYPRNEKAPMALFMAAYIKANELKNYTKATEYYNLFLKKYPKHELVSSARQELDIMGLSPDEVLKSKTAVDM